MTLVDTTIRCRRIARSRAAESETPFLRVGLGHYDMDWKGYASEHPHPSEFRYTWDPDVRTGVFTGWEF